MGGRKPKGLRKKGKVSNAALITRGLTDPGFVSGRENLESPAQLYFPFEITLTSFDPKNLYELWFYIHGLWRRHFVGSWWLRCTEPSIGPYLHADVNFTTI